MNYEPTYSGRFTADGNQKLLTLRSDVDWIEVKNETVWAAGGAGNLVTAYWQRGMATGIYSVKEATIGASVPTGALTTGFTLYDSSDMTPGALNTTITAVSNAAIPIVSATSTATLQNGDIVRMINVTGAQQLGGIDFTIDTLVANTSFRLPYMAQIVAGTTGSFRKIPYNPIFYPRHRYISSVTQAAAAVIELTVTHGYTVGQKVRFQVPAAYGMTQLDGLTGTITAINTTTNTITTDIDSTAFTAFAFPLTAAVPFTPAQVIPVGEAAEDAYTNLLDDATENQAVIGIMLAAGAAEPAGQVNDVISWRAGKSQVIITG
jgi:hypothetical protein